MRNEPDEFMYETNVIPLCICKYCGGQLGFFNGSDGRPIGLTHTLPYCDKFAKLEPDKFLERMRIDHAN